LRSTLIIAKDSAMSRFRLLLLIAGLPLVAAASAPMQEEAPTVDAALKQARAEAAAADAAVRRLDRTAANARDAAAQLRARQAAAAEAIGAAEARISAANAEGRIIAARMADRRARLTLQQRPVASLLAGLAMMARRPPLLALAGGGTDELVRVRVLLDATLPVIRRRTAALSAELAQGEQLEHAAGVAREALVRGRDELAHRRAEFGALEARASQIAASSGSAALGAGDVALASGELADRLADESARGRSAAQVARALSKLGPPPQRPVAAEGTVARAPLAYRLPSPARVTTGLGEISLSGVRSRGLTLATGRGAAVTVPAAGVVRFSGPFRDYDGIVIIDHGRGWMSLIVNVSSPLAPGAQVAAGTRLGRALGPLGVELSHRGRHWSPALIAGSSGPLSNGGKDG
jgi:septal ring factor EnvC (AmiA/AmiB activator)